jgi:hypothetical protein
MTVCGRYFTISAPAVRQRHVEQQIQRIIELVGVIPKRARYQIAVDQTDQETQLNPTPGSLWPAWPPKSNVLP